MVTKEKILITLVPFIKSKIIVISLNKYFKNWTKNNSPYKNKNDYDVFHL